MENIDINDFKKYDRLPQGVGLFVLYDGQTPLFVKSSENLRRFAYLYCDSSSEDKNILDLSGRIQSVSFQEYGSLVEAFIDELVFIDRHNPPYNCMIKPWLDYHYLAVNIHKPPYLAISHTTIGDDIYIGPFRSSFTLNDMLDTFAEVFKLPRCESEHFPCERLSSGLCLGYCQNKLGEALPEMLNRLIIVPNQEAIHKLNEHYEALSDDLEFASAEVVGTYISLLKRYYKNLLFSYTSQFIFGDFKIGDTTIFVKEGMITEIVSKDRYVSLKHTDLSYRRRNEFLAVEKSEYDHRWIVWNFLYQTQPKLIEELFVDNIVELQKAMFSDENEPDLSESSRYDDKDKYGGT